MPNGTMQRRARGNAPRRRLVATAVAALAALGTAVAVAAGDGASEAVRDGGPAATSARVEVLHGETPSGRPYGLESFASRRGSCLRLALGDDPLASEACGDAGGLGYVTVDDVELGERLVYGPAPRDAVAGSRPAPGGRAARREDGQDPRRGPRLCRGAARLLGRVERSSS